MVFNKLFYIFLFIIYIVSNAFPSTVPTFIKITNKNKPFILRDKSYLTLHNNGNKTLKNLESVYFSKTCKIVVFKYKDDGVIDIVTDNITDYYRRLYNNSNTTLYQKI